MIETFDLSRALEGAARSCAVCAIITMAAVAPISAAETDQPCTNPANCRVDGAEIDDEATIALRARPGSGPKFGIISDRRMKNDLQPVGRLANGLQIYAFQFAWETKVRVGLVAQDLFERADAKAHVLTLSNGLLAIDYAALGLRMATEREWIADGEAALVAGYRSKVPLEPEEQPIVLRRDGAR